MRTSETEKLEKVNLSTVEIGWRKLSKSIENKILNMKVLSGSK
jgi:hypothetical protein